MLNQFKIAMALAAISMLAACQTGPNARFDGQQVADTSARSNTDYEKISRVNQRNRSRGITTVWVNSPQRKDKKEDS